MSNANPIDLLFGDMEKLGPGSNSDTLKVLDMLPKAVHGVIVDAGCGAGRHTLAPAKRLQTLVHAVDSYEPFLDSLAQSAKEAGIEHLVQTHCIDMADIPSTFKEIDLLWSEREQPTTSDFHMRSRRGIPPLSMADSQLSVNFPGCVMRFRQKCGNSSNLAILICEVLSVAQDAGYIMSSVPTRYTERHGWMVITTYWKLETKNFSIIPTNQSEASLRKQ